MVCWINGHVEDPELAVQSPFTVETFFQEKAFAWFEPLFVPALVEDGDRALDHEHDLVVRVIFDFFGVGRCLLNPGTHLAGCVDKLVEGPKETLLRNRVVDSIADQ